MSSLPPLTRFNSLIRSQVELMGEGSTVVAAPRSENEKPSQQTPRPPSGSGNSASPSSKTQTMKQQPMVPKQKGEGNTQDVPSTTGSSSAPLPKRRNKRANKAASESQQGQEASTGVNGAGPSRAEPAGETKNQGVINGPQVSEAALDTKSLTKTLVGVIKEMRAAGQQEVRRPDKPRPKPAPKATPQPSQPAPQTTKPAQAPAATSKPTPPKEPRPQGEGKAASHKAEQKKAAKKQPPTPASGVSTASAPATPSLPSAPTGTSGGAAAPVVINVHVPSPPRSHGPKPTTARSEPKAPRGPKPSAPQAPPAPTQAPPPPPQPQASMPGTQQQLSTLYKLGLGQSHGLVQEVVPVPHALLEWTTAKLGDLNSILAKVKEKSGVLSIVTEQCREDGSKRLLISATGAEDANKAKLLLQVHLKNQESLSFTERRLQKVEDDITAVQGAVAAGLRIEFTVDPELTGLVIGKKGENIKRVYDATGVSKIDVNDGVIRIVGPSNAAVLHAREMLELIQSDMELSSGVGDWLTRPMLGDIRDSSECSLLRVLDGEDIVRIIGTKKQVENAKLLLETQVDYVMKLKELRANESEMRQKLYDMEASYGLVPQFQRRGPPHANANAGRRGRNEDGGYERTSESGGGEARFNDRKPSSRQRPLPGSSEGGNKTIVITTPSTAAPSSSSGPAPSSSGSRGPKPSSNGGNKWPTPKEATANK